MADSSYFLKILKENEKPRSTEFLQHKEQRYDRLTKQFYMVMTSQYFSKHKVAEKLALKILDILDTDEYPDEFCRDYEMQKKYLSFHVFMARNRQNTNKRPAELHMNMHMENLENFLYYINNQDFNAASLIAKSEINQMLGELQYNQVYNIGKYKYAENCNNYIMLYYHLHITFLGEFNTEMKLNLLRRLNKLVKEEDKLLPKNFFTCLLSDAANTAKCHSCIGTRVEFCLNTYYLYSMIKLNNDMNLQSKHAESFRNFDKLPLKCAHSIYCKIGVDQEQVLPSIIPLPHYLMSSFNRSPMDLCKGSFSNVIDTVVINMCKRSVLHVMCTCYKNWTIDKSNMVWKGMGDGRSIFYIKSIDMLLHMSNNVLIKFHKNKRSEGDETGEDKIVEAEKTKVAKQGKKKKMINQIVQTKSPLKDYKIKQTQTCMEESVIKDYKKLKQRIKSLESEKSRTQKEMNNLKEKMDKMSMKTAAINYELQKSQNDLKAREEELKSFKQKVDLLLNRNLSNEQKIVEKSYEFEMLCSKYNTLQVSSLDINARNQDLLERCERQKSYVLENMALKQEMQKLKEAYYRVTGECNLAKDQMNGRQKIFWDICNMLKIHLINTIRSMSDALQRYERRSLMIVMEYEAETGTEEEFKFMQHMGELKDKFKEFEIYCKNLEDLLTLNKLHEVVSMLRMPELVRIFEQCPNILFDDISKMITSLTNKDARIRKDQGPTGACYSPMIGGGDQAKICEHKPVNGEFNEYTDENGKYHLLFMRVKENVYNAENDDIIVKALQEIRRKNNNRMSFLTYEQIVNRVQHRIDESVEDNSCCICFHGYDDIPIRVLVCSHKFHKHCIEHWFRTNNVCPICRLVIAP